MTLKQIPILIALIIVCGCSNKSENIYQAVDDNNVSYVKNWLKKGGNPNLKANDGSSLLYIATGPHGGNGVVRALIEGGANPNIGAGKYTPLMNAASWVDLKGVNILLSHGADPNLENERGQTALDVVGRSGGSEKPVIEVLQKVTRQKRSSTSGNSGLR